jgi:hypothetical protein
MDEPKEMSDEETKKHSPSFQFDGEVFEITLPLLEWSSLDAMISTGLIKGLLDNFKVMAIRELEKVNAAKKRGGILTPGEKLTVQ